jgi:hypothetical protein
VPSAATDSAAFTHDLKHPLADEQKVIGTVTSHLPADLDDVSVIYKGNVYPQGRLDSGVPKRLDFTVQRVGIKDWMTRPFNAVHRPGTAIDDLQSFTTQREMKGILFYDKSEAKEGNTTLRHLDVGRVDSRTGDGPTEKVTTDPGTPSRLWLGALPGSGSRPKLDGTMTQRTIVRVYIPIQK